MQSWGTKIISKNFRLFAYVVHAFNIWSFKMTYFGKGYERMIEKIVEITEEYKELHKKTARKNKGQFFTPPEIARYMAMATAKKAESLSILDPGCGNAILSAAVVEACIQSKKCFNFIITLVENDEAVMNVTNESIRIIERYVSENGGSVRFLLKKENFITLSLTEKYDIVISNPPYKKLRKDSEEARCMHHVLYGQPNLYGLFMAKSLDALKEGGRFVFITPRSWTTGLYYKALREYVFKTLNIEELLLFNDRGKVFANEDVLQETMIMFGKKGVKQNRDIQIRIATGSDMITHKNITAETDLIKDIGEDHYLFLPSNMEEMNAIKRMVEKKKNFLSSGYIFKTGPVVEFRNKEYLDKTRDIRMYRAAHVVKGKCVFPVNTDKSQYISKDAKHLMIPNSPTVFVKRITAKEESKRLQCCVYVPSQNERYISVENHLNYLTRIDHKPLSVTEATTICNLLNSDLYDTYYRVLGGSTQVNAGDLNNLPL